MGLCRKSAHTRRFTRRTCRTNWQICSGRTITPETTLEELGLSSLEQVELLVELEERFNTTIDEASLRGARRLTDLAEQISHTTPTREVLEFIQWNRGVVARPIRRFIQVGLVLPVTRLCAHIKVSGVNELHQLAANHESYLDAPVILSALPPRWRHSIAPAMWKKFFDATSIQRYSLVQVTANRINFFLSPPSSSTHFHFPSRRLECATRFAI